MNVISNWYRGIRERAKARKAKPSDSIPPKPPLVQYTEQFGELALEAFHDHNEVLARFIIQYEHEGKVMQLGMAFNDEYPESPTIVGETPVYTITCTTVQWVDGMWYATYPGVGITRFNTLREFFNDPSFINYFVFLTSKGPQAWQTWH